VQSLLSPLSHFFLSILQFIHGWGISWSWSIVVLTIFVRIVLVPLTWRQIKSMRAMQALAPQIKELQEKYKDDKQLLNQKTMEFYQENKVSPFGSCLPLILQMPVFFGLYYMLREQGQPGGFFAFPNPTVGWVWIADITKFDVLLMFLYIASQFVASWQTARKSAGQQKAIAYMMPIIVGVFMFIGKWPAGLFIYWFTSNLWTIAQQYVAEKLMPMPVPVTTVSAKGKAPARTPAKAPVKSPAKAPVKTGAAKPGAAKSGTKTGTTPAKAKAQPTQPATKSGGKTSGQGTSAKGQAAGSKGQRPNGGASGPKSSG
jgi:YidC/Oxa1 family membrane protein insertase